jgi:DnaJ family protein A protein 2
LIRYEILSDLETRNVYDQYGMAGLTKGGPGGMDGMGAADIFAQFFGGAGMEFGFDFGPGAGRRRGKGEDTTVPYEVTLEDIYNGKTVKLNMEKEVVCGICKGCANYSIF